MLRKIFHLTSLVSPHRQKQAVSRTTLTVSNRCSSYFYQGCLTWRWRHTRFLPNVLVEWRTVPLSMWAELIALRTWYADRDSSQWPSAPPLKYVEVYYTGHHHFLRYTLQLLNHKTTFHSIPYDSCIQKNLVIILNFAIIRISVWTYVRRRKNSYRFTWFFRKPW
jgi:hypothetical protein